MFLILIESGLLEEVPRSSLRIDRTLKREAFPPLIKDFERHVTEIFKKVLPREFQVRFRFLRLWIRFQQLHFELKLNIVCESDELQPGQTLRKPARNLVSSLSSLRRVIAESSTTRSLTPVKQTIRSHSFFCSRYTASEGLIKGDDLMQTFSFESAFFVPFIREIAL